MFGPYRNDPERLHRELDEARRTIVSLMSDAAQEALSDYYRVQSRAETYTWRRNAIKKIIAMAVPIEPCQWDGLTRASCPLCKSMGHSFMGGEGYVIPGGLERHLSGYGRVRECDVTKAAFALADDYFDHKFSAAEEAERKQKAEERDRRLQEEIVYRACPFSKTELAGDDGSFNRSASEIPFAEERVAQLGFQAHFDGKVKIWSYEADPFVIFADVCRKDEVRFAVYKKPIPKPRSNSRTKAIKRFEFPDRWKHKLREKFLAQLSAKVG
jgi:hypothetical protein